MLPIAKPLLGKEEADAVCKVLRSGWIGQGQQVEEFERSFSAFTGAKYSCAVSSGTAALHLALLAAGTKPGDAVITVSHSFIATANSVRHCGAEPVFADIDLETFNISPASLEGLIARECKFRAGELFYKNKNRVSALMPVHQMGLPCDLIKILSIAKKFKLPVVEDAACALGSRIKVGASWEKIGRPHGDIACFSFHPRKVITTGEGGMVVTNSRDYDEKVRMLRQQGSFKSQFPVTGYNYRMTDIQAAIGIEQLKRLPGITKKYREVAGMYYRGLKPVSWLILPKEPKFCRSNWQSFPVRIREDAPLTRDGLMQLFLKAGISTRPGIMNAHQEKPYFCGLPLKNSELARDATILLPIFSAIKPAQVRMIIKLIHSAALEPRPLVRGKNTPLSVSILSKPNALARGAEGLIKNAC